MSFGSLYEIRQRQIMEEKLKAYRPPPTTVESTTAPDSICDVLPNGLCERCYRPWVKGQHGLGFCPLEPRREFFNLCGKDQFMQFTTQGTHPKLPPGIRITSMKHWERVLKERGVTADISLKERINRNTSGLAARLRQERRQRLKQRALPIVERAYRDQHTVRVS